MRNKNQTSPRPPIATVSHTALTDSFHNLLSNPCRPCTPLNRLRTSSTALRVAASEPELATTIVAAAAAAAADEGEIDFGQRRRRRKRRSTASAGRTTQRRKSGAKRMYGRSAMCIDSIRDDDDDALPLLGVVAVERVSAYQDVGRRSADVSLSLRRAGLCASRRCS